MNRASILQCPRCHKHSLETLRTAAGGLWTCISCAGAWLSSEMVKVFESGTAEERVALARQIDSDRVALVKNTFPKVSCPQCNKVTERLSLLGVEFDLCQKHGAWFDHGELSVLSTSTRRLRLVQRKEKSESIVARREASTVAVRLSELEHAAVPLPGNTQRPEAEEVVLSKYEIDHPNRRRPDVSLLSSAPMTVPIHHNVDVVSNLVSGAESGNSIADLINNLFDF
jgi:Zn-finger nucleic acid-binding protein